MVSYANVLSFVNSKRFGHDGIKVESMKNGEHNKKSKLDLYDSSTKGLILTIYSETGIFMIKNLDLRKYSYFVVSHDEKGVYNAVIADNIHISE